jgi:hypothetical protein
LVATLLSCERSGNEKKELSEMHKDMTDNGRRCEVIIAGTCDLHLQAYDHAVGISSRHVGEAP